MGHATRRKPPRRAAPLWTELLKIYQWPILKDAFGRGAYRRRHDPATSAAPTAFVADRIRAFKIGR